VFLEVISAFFVSFSFGFLFNIKGKYLILSGIGGSIGWFVYKFSLYLSLSEPVSMFLAAIFFSTYCEISARIYHTPNTLLSVCALIPLVPGYGIYRCIYELISSNYLDAMDIGINTLASSGALALGVIFISTIFRAIKSK